MTVETMHYYLKHPKSITILKYETERVSILLLYLLKGFMLPTYGG